MMYQLKSGFILRKIGDQIMAVPVGAQTSHIHGMIALTESRIDEGKRIGRMRQKFNAGLYFGHGNFLEKLLKKG